MRYLSICSGIEAASQAWSPLGWQCAGVSEIEPFPRAVLEQRMGAVPVDDDYRHTDGANQIPLFGDFTKIEAHHVGAIDLLVGGTPCQSFSIAGKRRGLDDPRGHLTLEFLALARRVQPCWIVWENVPGVLSDDNGKTFGAFLWELEQCGFRWAYRVIDAQFARVGRFGRAVPQRRRRVFVIGYSGAGRIDPRAVLFDRESLRGNPAPRREKREVAPTIPARSLGGGGLGTDFDCDGGLVAFTAKDHGGDAQEGVSPTLRAGGHSGSHANAGVMPAIAHTLKAEGFDASEDGTGRGTPIVPAIAFAQNQRDEVRLMDVSGALAAEPGMKQQTYVASNWRVRRLTPVECERLQGFPQITETARFIICSDPQKTDVPAVQKCLKSPSNVWLAGESGWTLSADAAEQHSSTNHLDRAPPVIVDVLIDLEQMAVEIRSAEKSFSSVRGADKKSLSPLCMPLANFAHLAALTSQTLAKKTQTGKVALPDNKTHSTLLKSGSSFVIASGDVTEVPVKDVESAMSEASRFITSITSHCGPNTPISDSTLQTLSYCVAHAIAGFIPGITKTTTFCVVRLTTSRGFTRINWRGKTAENCPDGPRYKALGNSMAVNVMAWIGERIEAVSKLEEDQIT